MPKKSDQNGSTLHREFTGNIYIFHSFDIGDDIDLEKVKSEQLLIRRPFMGAKYFKKYHTPLVVEPPHPHATSHCESAKLHNFGVLTLRYKIPFTYTFATLRESITAIENEYKEQSVEDAATIFRAIKEAIKQPHFFHLRNSYLMIQIDQESDISVLKLKEIHGNDIASMLRFETETLSEYKKNQIMEDAFGYYRGDLVVIDTEAAFMYDDEYHEVLDLFEFVVVQQLELQYYDQVLENTLNRVYEGKVGALPWRAYLPMWGTLTSYLIKDLGRLKVDISVITERLESSVKLAGEPYYSEVYNALNDNLDLDNWKEAIQNKLKIIEDISQVYQDRIRTVREDLFNVLIVFLIFMEFVVAIMHYLK